MKNAALAGASAVAAATTLLFASHVFAQQVEMFYQGANNDLVSNYTGTSDTMLCCTSNATTTHDHFNYGGLTYMETLNSASNRLRFLVDFDLSSLTGKGLTLTNATLVLTKASNGTSSATSDNDELSVNALTAHDAGWTQGTGTGTDATDGSATADFYSQSGAGNGTAWEDANGVALNSTGTALQSGTNSADGNAVIFANQGYFGTSTKNTDIYNYTQEPVGYQFSITDNTFTKTVQNWIDNPSDNAGLLIFNYSGTNSTYLSFDTSEFATAVDRPTLMLTFASVPEPASLALLAPGMLLLNRRRRRPVPA